jgi:histidine phosphotransferase ChpT
MALADALCARLCHDLASPLGTLMGALELAAEDPSAVADALPLANETAAALGARLKLLRAAWAGDCGPLTIGQLTELASGLPSRVRADLAALRDEPFDGPMSRALLNLLLLGAEALPRGGVVALSSNDLGGILVTVKGRAAAWPANLAQALLDPRAVPIDNPRAVQPTMAVMLAQAAGRRLSMLLTPSLQAEEVAPLLLAMN